MIDVWDYARWIVLSILAQSNLEVGIMKDWFAQADVAVQYVSLAATIPN